jgi:DNA-binding NarL/FixJ family response regulator
MTASRVLIAEDDPATCKVLVFHLQEIGLEADIASDGPGALQLWRTNHPALIILNVALPGIDGFEICRQVRDLDPQVPIVLVTAHADFQLQQASYDLGIDRYFIKPVDYLELRLYILALYRRVKRWRHQCQAVEYMCRVIRGDLHMIRSQELHSALQAIDRHFNLASAIDDAEELCPPPAVLPTDPETASQYISLNHVLSQLQAYNTTNKDALLSLDNHAGQVILAPTLIRKALASLHQAPPIRVASGARTIELTAEEVITLQLLVMGQTNRKMADILGISAKGVEKRLARLFAKLCVKNRTEAAALATSTGMIRIFN